MHVFQFRPTMSVRVMMLHQSERDADTELPVLLLNHPVTRAFQSHSSDLVYMMPDAQRLLHLSNLRRARKLLCMLRVTSAPGLR
jgi:hypothetical protein